jgi:hypothetical protein
MKSKRRLVWSLLLLAGCATSQEKTWIGKNVGVAVDSSDAAPAPAAGR